MAGPTSKSKGKNPAAQWYWADWLRDPALRSVSSGARGLWMDILCLMWECVPRGHLQTPAGKPYTTEMICRATGNISKEEVDGWLGELENSGVSSLSATGVIYSRRMVRDEHKRALCREAGKRGGNPTLKGRSKGDSKGQPKGDVKRKLTPSSSPSGEDGRSPDAIPPAFELVADYCRERNRGVDPQKFMDHYTSNGWMVGRNRMKDWRAAVRTWERNGLSPTTLKGGDLFAGQREYMERHGIDASELIES